MSRPRRRFRLRAVVLTLPLLYLLAAATPALAAAGPPAEKLVLAVVGNQGMCYRPGTPCATEQAVAGMVHAWQPDAIVSVGDNSYKTGSCAEVAGDGHRPSDSLPYLADIQGGRFYPATGDHDWQSGQAGIDCATRFFGRPTHYAASLGAGLLDLFVLDMNQDRGSNGDQAVQYRRQVAASGAVWKVTVDHQPFYSSGPHGTAAYTHWAILPSIDLYLSGHELDMEHLQVDGKDYVVDGVGGSGLQSLSCCVTGSVWHQSDQFGAVRLTVTPDALTVEFMVLSTGAAGGRPVHSFAVSHAGTAAAATLAASPVPAAGWGDEPQAPAITWSWVAALTLVILGFGLGVGCLAWTVLFGARRRRPG